MHLFFVTHAVYIMIRVNMTLMFFVRPFHVFYHNGLQTISHLFGDVPVSQVTKLAKKPALKRSNPSC